jgi:hypothetical protein
MDFLTRNETDRAGISISGMGEEISAFLGHFGIMFEFSGVDGSKVN